MDVRILKIAFILQEIKFAFWCTPVKDLTCALETACLAWDGIELSVYFLLPKRYIRSTAVAFVQHINQS